MVVIGIPSAAETGRVQVRTARPSRCTVQAPQAAMPHPNLVPVKPSVSRSTHSNGVSGSTSTVRVCPFTVSVIAMTTSRRAMRSRNPTGWWPDPRGVARSH